MTARNTLGLLESAYAFGLDDASWLAALASGLRAFDLGGGFALYVSELGEQIRMRSALCASNRIDEGNLREVVLKVPPSIYRRAHAPTPLRFSGEYFPVTTSRTHADLSSALSFEVPVGWGICAGDANVETITLVFYCDRASDLTERDRATLDCIGAHLGCALRLRSLLGEAPSSEHRDVEAVLSSEGTVLDLRGAAVDERPSLVDAVRRSERARLRGAMAEERLELWTALVEGQWSILEHVERDGKRLLLACRNEPRVRRVRALTSRERSVAQYAALGHPLKYIAYELGISISAVDAALDRALTKLRLGSRTELLQLFEG
jgi:DNA-binding CsgD family transcriptional regulator